MNKLDVKTRCANYSWRLAWRLMLIPALALGALPGGTAAAQSQPQSHSATERRATRQEQSPDSIFAPIYRDFYASYKLGSGDELAVRVARQPDYTLERVRVSPVGRIYHPLLGDVEVAGLSVEQVANLLTRELSEYLLDPKVSVELTDANSAKIGVLGEVRGPGIMLLSRPMTLLDALAAAGGITDFGSKSNVTLLRPAGGRLMETKVNVKRLLEGKGALAENPVLQAGDTIIVHGNTRKKINNISGILGFAQFVAFISRNRQY